MFFLDHIWLIPLLAGFRRGDHVLFRPQTAEGDSQRGLRRRCGSGVPVSLAVRSGNTRTTLTTIRASLTKRLSTPGWDRHRPHELRDARRQPAPFQADVGFLLDPLSGIWLLFVTGVGSSDPYLFDRIHGARGRVLPVLRIPQPVHVLHADADSGEQLCADVCGMGRRGAVLVSADRILFPSPFGQYRGQQGIHREPHWRRGVPAGHVHHCLVLRIAAIHRGYAPGAQRAFCHRRSHYYRCDSCFCSSALAESRRRFRFMFGCPMPWRVRRRFPR